MVFVKQSNFLSSVFFWANQATKDRFGRPDKKECSLNQKKEVLKNDKKSTFFIIGVFWAKQAREDRVLIFWIHKNAF